MAVPATTNHGLSEAVVQRIQTTMAGFPEIEQARCMARGRWGATGLDPTLTSP